MTTSIFQNVKDSSLLPALPTEETLSIYSLEADEVADGINRSSLALDAMLVLESAISSLEGGLSPEDSALIESTSQMVLSDLDQSSIEEVGENKLPMLTRFFHVLVALVSKTIGWISEFIAKVLGISQWKRTIAAWNAIHRTTDYLSEVGAKGLVGAGPEESIESFFDNTPSLEKGTELVKSGWGAQGSDITFSYPASMGHFLGSVNSGRKESTARLAEMVSMLIRQDKVISTTVKELTKLPTTSTLSAIETEVKLYSDPTPITLKPISFEEYSQARRFMGSMFKSDVMNKITQNTEYNVKQLKKQVEKSSKEAAMNKMMGLDTSESMAVYQKTLKYSLQLAMNVLKVIAKFQNSIREQAAASTRTTKNPVKLLGK